MPRTPRAPPLSLDDGALVRRALELHRLDGEIPRGVLARMAALLGVSRSTVGRVAAGANAQLSGPAREALESHVRDHVAHPLPPGSKFRGRPRAEDPPVDPNRLHSRGGGRIGGPRSAGSPGRSLYLLPKEEEAFRDLAAARGVVPGRLIAEAIEVYRRAPDLAPPAPPEGARRCPWLAGGKAIEALDEAIGGPRRRREHVRAAVLRLLAGDKKKSG